MPELPELEVTRGKLTPLLVGRTVTLAEARHPACLKTFEPPLSALVGRTVTGVERRGKFICLVFDRGLHLCIHLMLDGRFVVVPSKQTLARSHLFRLSLDSGSDLRVMENATKHRVQVYVAESPEAVPAIAVQGLDPLAPGFTFDRFLAALARRNQTAKSFLIDQRAVSSIGNCYSDEILHAARLSPFLHTSKLPDPDARRLFDAIPTVLNNATKALRRLDHIPDRRDRSFLAVHGRRGEPCPECATAIEYVSYSDWNIYYCPKCQTGGRKLADRRLSRLLK